MKTVRRMGVEAADVTDNTDDTSLSSNESVMERDRERERNRERDTERRGSKTTRHAAHTVHTLPIGALRLMDPGPDLESDQGSFGSRKGWAIPAFEGADGFGGERGREKLSRDKEKEKERDGDRSAFHGRQQGVGVNMRDRDRDRDRDRNSTNTITSNYCSSFLFPLPSPASNTHNKSQSGDSYSFSFATRSRSTTPPGQTPLMTCPKLTLDTSCTLTAVRPPQLTPRKRLSAMQQ